MSTVEVARATGRRCRATFTVAPRRCTVREFAQEIAALDEFPKRRTRR